MLEQHIVRSCFCIHRSFPELLHQSFNCCANFGFQDFFRIDCCVDNHLEEISQIIVFAASASSLRVLPLLSVLLQFKKGCFRLRTSFQLKALSRVTLQIDRLVNANDRFKQN